MMERELRIKKELERERGIVSENGTSGADYRSRISGSFHAARRRSKTSSGPNVVMLRLVVLLFITLFLVAFLTWGKPVFYSLFLFIPVYFYFKFKKNSN